MFQTVGDFIDDALSKNYLNQSDLFTTDKQVLAKVKKYLSRDKKFYYLWTWMNNKVAVENNKKDDELKPKEYFLKWGN